MKERETEDLRVIKEAAAKAPAPALPESLRQPEVEAMLTGKKQKKNLRPLRAAVSVAVAACVLLTSVVVFRDFVYAPAVVRHNVESAGEAANYKEIGKLITARRRAERSFSFNGFFGARKAADTADYAVEEEAAGDGAMSDGVTSAAAAASDGTAASASHAETNVRTEGVLEGDVIKTDGKYLYLLSGEGTELLIVDPAGEQREVSRIDLSQEKYQNATEFYLLQNRLAVLGSFYDEAAEKNRTTLRLYDIADPAAPALTRSFLFDGYMVSSRIAGEKLMLVTSFFPNATAFKAGDYTTFVPSYTEEGKNACYTAEDNLYLGASVTETGFTTVSLLDLGRADAVPQNASVFGSAGEIYCSGNNLYVYDVVYPSENRFFGARSDDGSGVKTCIQKYDVSGDVAVCTATGSVEGFMVNGFALDEFGGYLRVAAGDWNENRVVVLDKDLKQVGATDVLAKDEGIRSVRFMGNWAYVVTFMQTDPLFVVDLSNPAAPAVTGEVKLPGFSSYLHPAGEGLLLGLGYGGTEDGLDGSMKISLFDVSDPAKPKEVNSLSFADKELNVNYKAFVTLPDGSFLIPYTAYTEQWVDYGGAEEPTEPETAPPTEAETAPVSEDLTGQTPATLPLTQPPEAGPVAEPTEATVTEAGETATAVSEAAQTSQAPSTEAASAPAEEPIEGEFVYASHPGMLVAAVENGRLVLKLDLAGETYENRWADARASFIGDAGFLVSTDYRSVNVERFSLLTGQAEAARAYETKQSDGWNSVICY